MYQRTPDHNAVVARKMSYGSWEFNPNGQINGGLAVSGNTLFLDTLGGDLYAIHMKKRAVAWHRHVDHALMSVPLIYHGMVFVGSGASTMPPDFRTGNAIMGVPGGDAIYAYDAKTGAPKWSYRTDGEDMPTPVIADGALIFANGDYHAYALDPSNGRLLWKRKLDGIATMASATVAKGRAIISICRYRFPYRCETDALDPRNGRIVWRAPYGNADASPAYASGTVFVSGLDYARGSGSWPQLQFAYAIVAALDAATGKPLWIYRDKVASMPSDVGTAERAVAGTYADRKYFQSVPGTSVLFAFDARTGKILWQLRTLAPVKMSPLLYRGRLYVGGNAGVLYVINASTGKLLRIKTFRQPFTASPPVLVGDTLLLSQNRAMRAVPLQSLSIAKH